MKVLSIIGARPQFIKYSAVSRVLRKMMDEVLVHTGQHYDDGMSGVFFRELGIATPDYHLGIGSGAHGHQTGEMLRGIETIVQKEAPAAVLVYGDTNSTLAGALAAAKLHVPVVHVEAGPRSLNPRMTEEINRVVTDHLSDVLLCPTETAVENLRREGMTAGVHLIGDVMYDALLDCAERSQDTSNVLERLGVEAKRYLLATVHRADNTDRLPHLQGIMTAFQTLVESGLTIVFPVHPRTRKHLGKISFRNSERLLLIDPVPYLEMVRLEAMAQAIVTDSGGIQKEACWLGVPCVTLREDTEWVETIESGWNRLVGTDPDRIVQAVHTAGAGRPGKWPWKRGEASQSVATLVARCRPGQAQVAELTGLGPQNGNSRSSRTVALVSPECMG